MPKNNAMSIQCSTLPSLSSSLTVTTAPCVNDQNINQLCGFDVTIFSDFWCLILDVDVDAIPLLKTKTTAEASHLSSMQDVIVNRKHNNYNIGIRVKQENTDKFTTKLPT